jgi:hypothetical protein
MSEQKTHWKKLDNPDYLGAYSILDGSKNPKPIMAKIKHVRLENVTGSNGKKEECKVCYLEGQKPLILNATNSKAIAAVAKSPYIEDWQGVVIEIYATTTKMAGEVVDCLRVRTSAPKVQTKPPFDESFEKYDGYIQGIKKSDKGLKHVIDTLSKDFTITPEMHDFLAQIVGTEIHLTND